MRRGLYRDGHLRVDVVVRNDALVKAREDLGLNQRQMAAAIGVGASELGRLENLKQSPRHRGTGDWTVTALRIAEFHGLSPEEIWPDHVAALSEGGNLPSLPGCTALDAVCVAERGTVVRAALAKLSGRERLVVESRFGLNDAGGQERTLQEVGDLLGVTREMARHLEVRALAKLRRFSPGLRGEWADD